jgi:xanthine dehydrogenase accessory factor
MTLSRSEHARLDAKVQELKSMGVPFAMATIVRTVDATSAKPGGKALLDAGGEILLGWLGGGCARSAVAAAAREAISSGSPQFVSLQPEELLETEGVHPGETRDGVKYARNGCPSRGTMDVFVEPVLPLPHLTICGTGLVALALAELADRFDFAVTLRVAEGVNADIAAHPVQVGFAMTDPGFVVVATQGQGDMAALKAALRFNARHISFVGSRKKFQSIAIRLTTEDPGCATALARVKAPAGLDINAITPDEIALSILADITRERRARVGGREQHGE